MNNLRAFKPVVFLLFFSAFAYGQNLEVELVRNDEQHKVNVLIDNKPFTTYYYPNLAILKKPILYPIYSPKGNFITRGWPLVPRENERTDHPHHVGLWFNQGDVNGNDFWNNSNEVDHERGRYGTIVHTGIKKVKSGKKKGQLIVSADWIDHAGNILLNEETTFTFSGTENIRIVDRSTTFFAITNVLFADNKEGMLGLRLAQEMEHPDPEVAFTGSGKYQNDLGITGADVWSKRSEWMNLTGKIKDEEVSIAIFDHPKNHNFPTYWHARGYGLFAANPIAGEVFTKGQEITDLTLLKGEKATFKYRIIIASEQLSELEMSAYADEFVR